MSDFLSSFYHLELLYECLFKIFSFFHCSIWIKFIRVRKLCLEWLKYILWSNYSVSSLSTFIVALITEVSFGDCLKFLIRYSIHFIRQIRYVILQTSLQKFAVVRITSKHLRWQNLFATKFTRSSWTATALFWSLHIKMILARSKFNLRVSYYKRPRIFLRKPIQVACLFGDFVCFLIDAWLSQIVEFSH